MTKHELVERLTLVPDDAEVVVWVDDATEPLVGTFFCNTHEDAMYLDVPTNTVILELAPE